MRARQPRFLTLVVAPAICAALFSGCGGGENERQDAGDKGGTFEVEVVRASFSPDQEAGVASTLAIDVRNSGTETVPNLAVSLDGLRRVREQADLSDPKRPVWIIDGQPKAGVTAYVDTWALGPLKPGETRRHRWTLTPVDAGRASVRWALAGSLTGGARVRLGGGAPAEGEFRVRIRARSADATGRVDPATGALRDSSDAETPTDR